MKNRMTTGILFFLFLLTASGVFAAMVENSRQGLPAISVASHPAFSLESSEQRQGLSRVLLELVSGGAFISKDPIGFNGDINLYRYAANNPVIYTDPTGKVPQIIVFTLIAQELLALKITYDFYSTNLFPVCDKLCPGERAYVSGLTPPFSGAKIIVYKPKTDECGTDIFVEQGLLPFGDCAYGFAGYYGY